MSTEQEQLIADVFAFLDGLCIGHKIADQQRFRLSERCWQAMPRDKQRNYLAHWDETANVTTSG